MKTCSKCKENKPLDCYYRKKGVCKVCVKAYQSKWTKANRVKRNAQAKKRYAKNRGKELARFKRYRLVSREKRAASNKKYRAAKREKINAQRKQRYKTDHVYATTCRLRTRITGWLKGNKSATTEKLIGCTFKECNQWIECQFVDGMSWENRDKWHIDHMMPLKSFNILDPEQQRIACHYTNLQPLWGPENDSKGSKIVYDMIWREHWYIKIDGEYISRLNLGRARSN